jgi:mono/diheme cytochrome c family protein
MRIPILLTIAVGLGTVPAGAQSDPRVQRGRVFAQANCASCHAVGPSGESPLRVAPPFRVLYQRYPAENLAEALAEGIVTGHPSMPQFQLDPGQIRDLIAYLDTLAPKPKRG